MDSSDRSRVTGPLLRTLVRVTTGYAVSLLVIAWASSSIQDVTYAIRIQNHPNHLAIGFDSFGWFWSPSNSPGIFLAPSATPTSPRFVPYHRGGTFLQYNWSTTPTSEWHWLGVRYRQYVDPFSTISILYLSHHAVLCAIALLFSTLALWRYARNRRHCPVGLRPRSA